MMTLARRSLALSALLWLGAGCGGDESTPSKTASETSVTPSAAGTGSAPTKPSVATGSTPPKTTAGSPGSVAMAGTGAVKAPAATAGTGTSAGAAGSASPPSTGTAGAAAPAGAGGAAALAGTGGASGGMTDKPTGTPTLFWLAFNSSQVMMSKDMKTATMFARTGTAPDGVAVDVSAGKVFWTNMGSALGTGGGTVQSANLDGSMVTTIIPVGVGTTFKQTTLDLKNKKLYWGDREGRKLWRSDYDGKNHEAIVSGQTPEVVGVVVDSDAGKVYFTDRTGGKIWRTNIEMPDGATAETRKDLEMVLEGPPGSNTIDLEIDHTNKVLYWTDRTLGAVHSMQLDKPETDKVIVPNVNEPIGICLDVPNGKIYFAELGGSISSAGLDGSGVQKGILRSSGATGCTLVYIP
ncbi:MAG TPA: hypothetical protein VFN67_42695 [Polyangiales bacterium]|nr:hypothetical protein [Polyangiales bacterium]